MEIQEIPCAHCGDKDKWMTTSVTTNVAGKWEEFYLCRKCKSEYEKLTSTFSAGLATSPVAYLTNRYHSSQKGFVTLHFAKSNERGYDSSEPSYQVLVNPMAVAALSRDCQNGGCIIEFSGTNRINVVESREEVCRLLENSMFSMLNCLFGDMK